MSDLLLDFLTGQGLEPRHEAATNGGEWASACPFCGGRDRFRAWPEAGRWWCRSCERKGDLVDLYRERLGMTYPDACRAAGKAIPDTFERPRQTTTGTGFSRRSPAFVPRTPPPPPDAWQEKAGAFVAWAGDQLQQNPEVLAWLERERGLTASTVRAARLGWNPGDLYREREAWGLPPETNAAGKPKVLWLPAGLVIPCFFEGRLARVKVRRSAPDADPRYVAVAGGQSVPLVAGDGPAVVVVESELDAILIGQEAGDLVAAVALGSASNRPDQATAARIAAAGPRCLVALDSDEAGGKAAWGWWREAFPTATRWPVVEGKDPTAAMLAGVPVRAWVEAGLSPAPEPPRPGTAPAREASVPTLPATGAPGEPAFGGEPADYQDQAAEAVAAARVVALEAGEGAPIFERLVALSLPCLAPWPVLADVARLARCVGIARRLLDRKAGPAVIERDLAAA